MARIYALLGILVVLAGLVWGILHKTEEAAVQGERAEVAQNAVKQAQAGLDAQVATDAQTASETRRIVAVARQSTASARKAIDEKPRLGDAPDPEFDGLFNSALEASRGAVATARSLPR